MDFNFNAEQTAIQQRLQEFCRRELLPRAKDLDSAAPAQSVDMIRERLKNLAKAGLLGLGFPAAAGGAGGDLMAQTMLYIELGETCPATGLAALASAGLCARALADGAETAERGKYLAGLLSGEIFGAYAAGEPSADIDSFRLQAQAVPATGGFSLQGKKAMVVNAPLARVIVTTATLDGAPALFLLTQDAARLEVTLPQDKLGFRGTPTADVMFNDCVAVKLGGAEAVERLRIYEHLFLAALATGILGVAVREGGLYARSHKAGAHALIKHEEISFKLADARVFLDVARMLIHRSIWMLEDNNPEAAALVSSAKLQASETAVRAVNSLLQIVGAEGYVRGALMERLYRDAKLLEILGDSTEKHRMFIADQVLAAV